MAEVEVFRINPVLNKCYEHAEDTRVQGTWPEERYFTNVPPTYVGEFIRFEQSGAGDGSQRTDYFRHSNGNEVAVYSSYEGRTSFREVPCRQQSDSGTKEKGGRRRNKRKSKTKTKRRTRRRRRTKRRTKRNKKRMHLKIK